MPRSKGKSEGTNRWIQLEMNLMRDYPHVGLFLQDPDGFRELRLKARDDGTILAIAKGTGSDGGPVVCFGVGYDAILALMGLESTMQGGNWREDKPWQASK